MVPTSTTENSAPVAIMRMASPVLQGTVYYTDINDYTFVAVVVGVKDQRFERRALVTRRGREYR